MKAMTQRFSVLAALLVVFAAGACDDARDPTSVQQPGTASWSLLEMGVQTVQKDAGCSYHVLSRAKMYTADTVVSTVITKGGRRAQAGRLRDSPGVARCGGQADDVLHAADP